MLNRRPEDYCILIQDFVMDKRLMHMKLTYSNMLHKDKLELAKLLLEHQVPDEDFSDALYKIIELEYKCYDSKPVDKIVDLLCRTSRENAVEIISENFHEALILYFEKETREILVDILPYWEEYLERYDMECINADTYFDERIWIDESGTPLTR